MAHYPNCTLTLAGEGPLQQIIRNLCDELGISDKVQFAGRVAKEQVIELMERSDIFLHHSVTAANGDQEGIPTVLMEAMAMGLIVISSYHSGIPELIENGRTGFLVVEKDISSYVQTMLTAINASPNLPLLASHSIQTSFNMEIQNDELKQIYKSIINI